MPASILDEITAYLAAKDTRLTKRSRVLLEGFLALAGAEKASRITADALRAELGAREGKTPEAASLRQRLKRLNDTLAAAKASFELKSSGGDVSAEPTGAFDAGRQMDRVGQALRGLSNEATRLDSGGLVEPKASLDNPVLWVFFSYASLPDAEQRIQDAFFDLLSQRLNYPPAEFAQLPRIKMWRDERHIEAAQTSNAQMDAGCSQAFLGLLMLSNKYPYSAYCQREANFFLAQDGKYKPGKTCVLIEVNLSRHQIPERFTYDARPVLAGARGKNLIKLWSTGKLHDRVEFADRVAREIFIAARNFHKSRTNGGAIPPAKQSQTADEMTAPTSREPVAQFMYGRKFSTDPHEIVEARARRGLVSPEVEAPRPNRESRDEGVPIVEHLINWAAGDGGGAPRLVAVLGEFGMGKTVACQMFAQRLLDLGKTKPKAPVPIYLDLRDVEVAESDKSVPLESLVDQMLRKVGERPPSARDVIKFARERNAIVVFDGLDEITNKLSPEAAVRLYRELLGIVPAECWAADYQRRRQARTGGTTADDPMQGPRVVVSCRTHYFRDVAAQRGFLTGTERARLEADQDIAAYFMLPFTAEQIEAYLQLHPGKEEAERALALINETYNLRELAERPILLRFIRETIGRIEDEKLAGRPINLARLYDILVDQSLERDNPKHTIPIREKRAILQALALHLHARGTDEIGNNRLDEWFQDYVPTVPRLATALQGAGGLTLSEIFAQDLRNASLLVRPGEKAFRFAHTSIREYFLAAALYAAGRTGKGNSVWDVPLPTPETLTFLLQRHAVEEAPERQAFEREFVQLIEAGQRLRVRRLAFALWRSASASGTPLLRPKTMDLSDLDLRRATFAGTPDRLMPMQQTTWHGTQLHQAEFQHADLSGADFSEAEAPMSRWLSCALQETIFGNANLTGSLWRNLDIPRGALDLAELGAVRAIGCRRAGQAWHPHLPYRNTATRWRARPLSFGAPLAVAVAEIAGKHVVVSGRDDKAIRVFDLASGQQIALLEGHQGYVLSVAVAEIAGKHVVVSGSYDKTIRVFDLASGQQIALLEDHQDCVNSIAVAEIAGKHVVVSGSSDKTIRVFDFASGQQIA
ncbi:MAG: NACHT domain-containing protein, partial [Xanthobacteraceae bacterium]